MDDPNQFAVKQNTVPMHMTEERSQMLNEHQMQSAHMQAQQNMTEVQNAGRKHAEKRLSDTWKLFGDSALMKDVKQSIGLLNDALDLTMPQNEDAFHQALFQRLVLYDQALEKCRKYEEKRSNTRFGTGRLAIIKEIHGYLEQEKERFERCAGHLFDAWQKHNEGQRQPQEYAPTWTMALQVARTEPMAEVPKDSTFFTREELEEKRKKEIAEKEANRETITNKFLKERDIASVEDLDIIDEIHLENLLSVPDYAKPQNGRVVLSRMAKLLGISHVVEEVRRVSMKRDGKTVLGYLEPKNHGMTFQAFKEQMTAKWEQTGKDKSRMEVVYEPSFHRDLSQIQALASICDFLVTPLKDVTLDYEERTDENGKTWITVRSAKLLNRGTLTSSNYDNDETKSMKMDPQIVGRIMSVSEEMLDYITLDLVSDEVRKNLKSRLSYTQKCMNRADSTYQTRSSWVSWIDGEYTLDDNQLILNAQKNQLLFQPLPDDVQLNSHVLDDEQDNKEVPLTNETIDADTLLVAEIEAEILNDKSEKKWPKEKLRYHLADYSSKPLFTHMPNVLDIKQGFVGDCYLLAVLGSMAAYAPQMILNMMKDNGTTVTVTFPGADPVTVSKKIPVDINGNERAAGGELWVQIMEKAYAASGLRKKLGYTKLTEKQKEIVDRIMKKTGLPISRKNAEKLVKNSVQFLGSGRIDETMKQIAGLKIQAVIPIQWIGMDMMDETYDDLWKSTVKNNEHAPERMNEAQWKQVKVFLNSYLKKRLKRELKFRDTMTVSGRNLIDIEQIRDTLLDIKNWKRIDGLSEYERLLVSLRRKFPTFSVTTERMDGMLRELADELMAANDTLKEGFEHRRQMGDAAQGHYSQKAKQLFQSIKTAKDNGRIIAAATSSKRKSLNDKKGLNNETISDAIAMGHGYSVVDCEERTENGITQYYIKLNNPWRSGGIRYRQYTDVNGMRSVSIEESKDEDFTGMFEMELNDFMQYFSEVTVSEQITHS